MRAAILLAAGASTRLGFPKALVRVGSEVAVARACRQLASLDVHTVVVLGADASRIRTAVPASARVVVNETWTRGRTGSLKAGVNASPDGDVLVWPIDHPLVATPTLHRLLSSRGAIRIPVLEGRRGHPVVFDASVRKEMLALGDDQPLHDVVHTDPSRVAEVRVSDPGVLCNVDTPDDLKKLEGLLRGETDARPPA